MCIRFECAELVKARTERCVRELRRLVRRRSDYEGPRAGTLALTMQEEQQTLITFALTLPSNLSQKQKRLMQLALRLPDKGLSEEQTEALKLVVNTIKPLPPP